MGNRTSPTSSSSHACNRCDDVSHQLEAWSMDDRGYSLSHVPCMYALWLDRLAWPGGTYDIVNRDAICFCSYRWQMADGRRQHVGSSHPPSPNVPYRMYVIYCSWSKEGTGDGGGGTAHIRKSWSDREKTSCLFTPPQHINYPSPSLFFLQSTHTL